MSLELCKGVHCVDLGESFQTHIYLEILASIQPRTSPQKLVPTFICFARLREATHARWKKCRAGAHARADAEGDAPVGADLRRRRHFVVYLML